jgi:hypothetical protein
MRYQWFESISLRHPKLLILHDFTIGEDEPKKGGVSGGLRRVLRGGGRERPKRCALGTPESRYISVGH